MNAITENTSLTQQDRGLYHKYVVERTDGSTAPGGKHHGDDFFVLNLSTDKHAKAAIAAYAKSCEQEFPVLASDLRSKLFLLQKNEFVTVPEVTLPNGIVVPSFQVGKYITGRESEQFAITDTAEPWVDINYYDAIAEAEKAGLKMITELQYLAIAHDIAQQAINWTGGAVGSGSLYQGLRNDTVDEAQPGNYVPEDADERRWHELSNGERVHDFAGNCFTWVIDNVQGNEHGLIEKPFAKDSPSLTTAPAPSMEQGCGWRPTAGVDWSGGALVRGGCWDSEDDAGVFRLDLYHPGSESGIVGFRCTKSLG